MRTRSLLTIVAMVLSLTAAFGPSVPVVLAQEATPVAVAPPQDLLPANADYEPARPQRSTASTSTTRSMARDRATR